MIGTSSCHLSYLEDYPIAYFVFFCIFLSCISFFTNWAWVRCVWKQYGEQVSPAYIFGFVSVSVCVYFIVLVFCISIFHILHFWQNKLSMVRLEAAGLEPAICLAFEDLCLYLFYLYLCCLYFFISLFFYFILSTVWLEAAGPAPATCPAFEALRPRLVEQEQQQGKCPQLPSWVLVHFRLLACHHQFNLIRVILCYACL